MRRTRIILVLLLGVMLVAGIACGTTEWKLTTIVDGQGEISPSTGTFPNGEVVTLTALPESGSDFDHWGGQASGSENPITITMDSDTTIYAYFAVAPTSDPLEPFHEPHLFLPTWVINGTLSASDDMQGAFMRAPYNCTMDWTMAAVASAPVGADIIIEIWYFDEDDPWPGSLVWYNSENALTIADGTNDGFSYLHNTGDLQTVRWGGFWYIKIKQVGSTTPGTTLTVTLCAIRAGRYVEKGSGETGSQAEAVASDETQAVIPGGGAWTGAAAGAIAGLDAPQPVSPFGILDAWSKRNWQ